MKDQNYSQAALSRRKKWVRNKEGKGSPRRGDVIVPKAHARRSIVNVLQKGSNVLNCVNVKDALIVNR